MERGEPITIAHKLALFPLIASFGGFERPGRPAATERRRADDSSPTERIFFTHAPRGYERSTARSALRSGRRSAGSVGFPPRRIVRARAANRLTH